MQEYPAGQAPPGPRPDANGRMPTIRPPGPERPCCGLVLVKCWREHRKDIALTSPHPIAGKRYGQDEGQAEAARRGGQAPPAAAWQRDGVGLIRFGGQVS